MKKLLLGSAIVSALFTPMAFAETPSFNMVEGGYGRLSSIGSDENADGFIIRGSAELSEMVYINGEYTTRTIDDSTNNVFSDNDIDLNTASIGLGVTLPLGKNTAVYGEANYVNLKSKGLGQSDTEIGRNVAFGVRSMISPSTEIYGELANTEMFATATEMTAGVRQYFNSNVGVFAEYSRNDLDSYHYNVGVSYRF
ncbi:MAG: porin family protein [Agarilytica sp.]